MGLYDVSIIGTGSYVPETIVTNADMEALVETNDEWIRARTGIRERRKIGPEESVTDLGTKAAQRALLQAGIAAEEIDLIVGASITHDLVFPSLACMVQRGIGASRAAAFDVNAACSGFVFALVQGVQFLLTGTYKTALIVAAEGITRYLDYTDRNSCILFGDGSGAIVLRATEHVEGTPRKGFLDFDLGSAGERVNVAFCPRATAPEAWLKSLSDRETVTPHIWQEGRSMFKAAVSGMSESVKSILTRQGLSADDIQLFVPHQANIRIIEAVGERVGIPLERVALCIEEYGNTSAASVGLAFDKWNRLGRVHKDDLVMFTAFAGGLAWGSILFRM